MTTTGGGPQMRTIIHTFALALVEARLAEIEQEGAAFAIEIPGELEQRRLRRTLRERLGQFDRLLSDLMYRWRAKRCVRSSRGVSASRRRRAPGNAPTAFVGTSQPPP
jgi:hypothetical protein